MDINRINTILVILILIIGGIFSSILYRLYQKNQAPVVVQQNTAQPRDESLRNNPGLSDPNAVEVTKKGCLPERIVLEKGEPISWISTEPVPALLQTTDATEYPLNTGQPYIFPVLEAGEHTYIIAFLDEEEVNITCFATVTESTN